MAQALRRCDWSTKDPIYIRYHDREWGTPLHDDKKLFEFLTLEGAQAGLSWLTVLKKRENYRKAFDNFDPDKVSEYRARKVAQLMADKGIIRNRLKILSTINNAKAFLKVQDEFGSFDSYIWGLIKDKRINNRWARLSQIPARTVVSDAMSRDLIKRGFRFVGSTICYSHMQATGMVNDHLTYCFRYKQV